MRVGGERSSCMQRVYPATSHLSSVKKNFDLDLNWTLVSVDMLLPVSSYQTTLAAGAMATTKQPIVLNVGDLLLHSANKLTLARTESLICTNAPLDGAANSGQHLATGSCLSSQQLSRTTTTTIDFLPTRLQLFV